MVARFSFSRFPLLTTGLLQKQAQLDEDGHVLLHDVTLLWIWVKDKMGTMFPADVVDKHEEMFFNELLG